jgi:hypothetical protein
LLLPLWDVAIARRVREDVRNAEVCVAMVGDVVCAAEEQDYEGCDEGGAAVCAAGTCGAGGGGWGAGGGFAVRRVNSGEWLADGFLVTDQLRSFGHPSDGAQDDTFL